MLELPTALSECPTQGSGEVICAQSVSGISRLCERHIIFSLEIWVDRKTLHIQSTHFFSSKQSSASTELPLDLEECFLWAPHIPLFKTGVTISRGVSVLCGSTVCCMGAHSRNVLTWDTAGRTDPTKFMKLIVSDTKSQGLGQLNRFFFSGSRVVSVYYVNSE